ncbi:hypothetical protein [Stappia sp. WLB 29]|uniref:hypothetical protein n=1 Tax=Stappia sp. WLB 29 TaxID=2925220 RepID=UPI0020BE96E0|nr:hypothetical protein [Stappia sp. WLB 29]
METLLDPLASPYNLAVLAAIAVLVAAALVMIAHGKREGNYGSERFSRATHDTGVFDSDTSGCDGD